MFLLVSYSTNMGLVLILLNLLKAQRIGIAGVWGCLVSFQVCLPTHIVPLCIAQRRALRCIFSCLLPVHFASVVSMSARDLP